MEFKANSRKGALILLLAIVLAVGIPLFGYLEWQYFKYCFPFFVGAFFFLMVNRFNIGDGSGATIIATCIGWIVPLTGIPHLHQGIYGSLMKPEYFGPVPLEFVIYSLPFVIGLSMLLSGHKVLPR